MPFQRLERVGIEPDGVVEPAQPVAHASNDIDQQRRRGARNLGKGRSADPEDADRRARPHGGRALKMRQRAKLANQTRRIEGGDRNGAARAVGDHRHLSREDQRGVVRLLPLDHESCIRLVGPQFADFDQIGDVVLGDLAECAGRPNGRAQRRKFVHSAEVASAFLLGPVEFEDQAVGAVCAMISHAARELLDKPAAEAADFEIRPRPLEALDRRDSRVERPPIVDEFESRPVGLCPDGDRRFVGLTMLDSVEEQLLDAEIYRERCLACKP